MERRDFLEPREQKLNVYGFNLKIAIPNLIEMCSIVADMKLTDGPGLM
jgi:hypothetical protein